MIKNTTDAYGVVNKTIHWVIAILVIGMVIFGLYLGYLPDNSPYKGMLINLHKSVGMTILILMLFRLYWRIIDRLPVLPITVPSWEKKAAHSVQACFYIVLLIMPISGWIMSSFGGHPVMFWGLFNARLPVSKNTVLAGNFFTVHSVVAWMIVGLLVLHIGAAFKHHFIEKNNVLRRMLPGYKPPQFFSE